MLTVMYLDRQVHPWNQCNWSLSEQTFQKEVSSTFSCTTWYLEWKKENCPPCGVFLLIHSGGGHASEILELLLSSSHCYSRFLQNSEIVVTLLSPECTLLSGPFVERLYSLPLTDAWKEKLYRIHPVDLWGKVSSVWLQKRALYLQTMSNSSVSCLAGVHNVLSTAVRNSSEMRCCTSFQENNWTNRATSPKSMLTMVVTIHCKVWFRNKGFMVLLMVEKVYIKGRMCQKQYMSGFLLSSLPLKTLLLNL